MTGLIACRKRRAAGRGRGGWTPAAPFAQVLPGARLRYSGSFVPQAGAGSAEPQAGAGSVVPQAPETTLSKLLIFFSF